MGKKLVLAGAGHAHILTMHHVRDIVDSGHTVTVIGPARFHYYSGMGPGMLGGTYSENDIRFDCRSMVESRGGTFLEDSVVRVDPVGKRVELQSGGSVEYDVLSCNCGSTIDQKFNQQPTCPVFPVKPIENMRKAAGIIEREGSERILKIAIIGGGPSAAELAGNIVQLALHRKLCDPEVTIYSRGRFMARFDERVARGCFTYLTGNGVKIVEECAVDDVDESSLVTADGQKHQVDIIFGAQGVTPSSIFRLSGIETGPDGGLLVNEYLQSVQYPEIFGGGDCISYQPQPLDKVGVYAVRQNPVLLHNVQASLAGKPLQSFSPGGGYLLIFNLGNGYGVLKKNWLVMKGRIPFLIKDFIDRRFMKKFQE